MSSSYENRLTDFVKRVRPLLVSISESTVITVIKNQGASTLYFAPALHGWNNTTSAQESITSSISGVNGIEMTTTEDIKADGYFMTPSGWSGTLTVTALYRTVNGSNNLYMRNFIQGNDYFTPGTGATGNNGPTAFTGATAVGAYKVLPVSVAVTSQSLIRVYCYRYGSHASDTYSQSIYFLGWEVEYS